MGFSWQKYRVKFEFTPYLLSAQMEHGRYVGKGIHAPRDAYEKIADAYRRIWTAHYLEIADWESASIEILDDKLVVTGISNSSFEHGLSEYHLVSEPYDGFNFESTILYNNVEYRVGYIDNSFKILSIEYLSTEWCDED